MFIESLRGEINQKFIKPRCHSGLDMSSPRTVHADGWSPDGSGQFQVLERSSENLTCSGGSFNTGVGNIKAGREPIIIIVKC